MDYNARINRLLADAIVIGVHTSTGQAKLRDALRFMAAHGAGKTITLPADIVAIPGFVDMVSKETGDRFEVMVSTKPLPAEAMAAARKRQAKRKERAKGCSTPNCTANNPGCANGNKDE